MTIDRKGIEEWNDTPCPWCKKKMGDHPWDEAQAHVQKIIDVLKAAGIETE